MKKWLIGGVVVRALVVALLVGILVTGALAQGPPTTPPSQGPLTPEQAKIVAVEANPGTTALGVEQENEHGTLVYEVQLDNGLEVKVDASNGTILGTEREDAINGIDDVD